MAYLLDTNVFIQAKNLHNGFDFCPAFWEWLIRENEVGRVCSIELVGNELLKGRDELADWARDRGGDFFVQLEPTLLPALRKVSSWATGHGYDQAAVSTFFQVADFFLVAQAYAGQHTVVTHEKPSGSKRKIKIPDACLGLKIKCITPYEMLKNERARFVLGT